MRAYVDTSVVLRHLLDQPNRLEWSAWDSAYSSEMLGVEARRVIDRFRLDCALDDGGVAQAIESLIQMERCIGCIRLTRIVLGRASLPMPTVVGTLDAIHLASALLLREHRGGDLVFATHDMQQATGARALGFVVAGV
jgi:hypothetical protein